MGIRKCRLPSTVVGLFPFTRRPFPCPFRSPHVVSLTHQLCLRRTFIQPLHPTSHLHTGFASMLEIDVPLLIDRCIVSIPSQPQGTLKAPPKASLMHAPQVSANNCRTNLIRDWPEPPAVPGGIVEAAPKDIALLANQNTSQQRPAIDASSQSRKCNISLDNVTVAGRDL